MYKAAVKLLYICRIASPLRVVAFKALHQSSLWIQQNTSLLLLLYSHTPSNLEHVHLTHRSGFLRCFGYGR
jgi:hypothetical protein